MVLQEPFFCQLRSTGHTDAMIAAEPTRLPANGMAQDVLRAFLVLTPDELVTSIKANGPADWLVLVRDAAEGLVSVVHAGSLPFQLTYQAVHQRRFDQFHSAERIRGLKDIPIGAEATLDQERAAYERAGRSMRAFLSTSQGTEFLRDAVVNELHDRLQNLSIALAASELMQQSVVATWGVFETFATSFVVAWINADGRRAKSVISAPALRNLWQRRDRHRCNS